MRNELLEVIDQIYASVDDPLLWVDIVKQLSNQLESPIGWFSLEHIPHDEKFVWLGGGDLQEYKNYWSKEDVLFHGLVSTKENKFHKSDCFCPDDVLLKSRIYQDFLKYQGVRHLIGGHFNLDGKQRPLLLFAADEKDRKAYSDDEIDYLNSLAPHITRSIVLNRRLDLLLRFAENQLEINEMAFLCDAKGKVQEILPHNLVMGRYPFIDISVHGKLVLRNSSDNELLRRMVSSSLSNHQKEVGSIRVRGLGIVKIETEPWLNTISHLFGDGSGYGSIVYFKLLSKEDINISDLTRTELEVLKLLCNSASLKDISKQRSVKLSTIRQQVKSCLEKTNTHSQAELISKVLNSGFKFQ